MAASAPRFERVRARRCRRAYRWVRGTGYTIMFSGIGLVIWDTARGASMAGEWSAARSIGMLCVMVSFLVFVASYGLYIAIRTIETKIARIAPESSDDAQGA